jgi:molybdenum cofactor cytidylyltransferase
MIAGLVLAAGESSRMGRDKALLAYRGRSFLETIVAILRETGVEKIAVVLGHHADEIRRATNLESCEVVVNSAYAHGQTSSLQAGLRALANSELEAVVLCLVDHPAVQPATISKLVASFSETSAPVVIPTFRGQRGHPVLLASWLCDELLRLSPDIGANSVIRKYSDATKTVEVDDAGTVLDVDDSTAYRRLEGKPL